MHILPKNPRFFELFEELGELTEKVGDVMAKLPENFSGLAQLAAEAREIEHEADAVTHEIINTMDKTFITPLDREDIYALAHGIDEVIDLIENALSNLLLYGVRDLRPEVGDFAEVIQAASHEIKKLIALLSQPKHAHRMKEHIIELHSLENRGDEIFKRALKTLFTNGTDAVSIIKWKDLMETLEKVLDQGEDVANVVNTIIVKYY